MIPELSIEKMHIVILALMFVFLLNCFTAYAGGFRVVGTFTGPGGVGFVDELVNDKGDMWLIWWKDDQTIIKAVYIGARDTGVTGVKDASKPSRRDIEDALRRHGSKNMTYPPEVNAFIQRHLSRHTLDPIWNPGENVRGAPGSSRGGEKPTPASIKRKAQRGRHSNKKEDQGKNNTPSSSTQPGFGGMGTRDDKHPERVNPVPIVFKTK